MPSRRALLLAPLLGLGCAAEDPWSVELRTEPSRVEIGASRSTWWTSQVQALYRDPERGGGFLSAEAQQRGSRTDTLLSAGGYLRRGDWTFWAQGAAGPDPVFVPKLALEAQAARKVAGGLHLAAGVQRLEFPLANVRLASVAAFYYFAAGELELRVRQGRNQTFDHAIQARMLRWLLDRGGTFAFGGTAVVGHNLFDTLAIPVEGGRGWTANANLRWRIDPRDSLRFDAGVGREAPGFRQRLLGISYRRSF